MPTAYSYIRFSSLSQSDGRSQPRQFEACEKFCIANNLDLAREEEYTFLDRGKSGYKAEHLDVNGQLRRFLALVDNGTVAPGSFLIVESLDRLSREHVKSALPRFMDILDKGINIVTLSDGKTYTSEYTQLDLILSILIMSRAHEESDIKSQRVGDAWRKKKEKARLEKASIGNNAPRWLDYTPDAPGNSYSINEGRIAIVRRIFDMSIKGYGKAIIVKTLNAESIPSFNGKTWAVSSLQKLLSNRALLGEYQPYTGRGKDRNPTGAPIPGYYPVAIDESTFYQAQEAAAGRRIAGATKQTPRFNIWQGVARCECLGPLHLVNKGKSPKGGTYLHCYAARKGLCKAKAIRLDQSEPVFAEVLTKVNSLSLVQDSSASLSKQISEIEGRLAEQNGKLEQHEASMREYPSLLLARLAKECEQDIATLSKEKEALLLALASEIITNKEDFIAKLDLVTYEGRYRANALLKRLKVKVAIYRVDDDSKEVRYLISANGKFVRGMTQSADGRIVNSLAFTADQLDKGKVQDFDGSIESSLDMLLFERSSDIMVNSHWWDDATLDGKITEMLARVGVDLATDSPDFQYIKDRLDLDRAMASPRHQEWLVKTERWLDSLDGSGQETCHIFPAK